MNKIRAPYELPEGWEWSSLSEIGDWTGGGTPSKEVPSYWSGGSIPWVSPKDMKSTKILDSEDKITELAVENSSAKLISAGALLFVVRSGILRRMLPVALLKVDAAVNQDLKALTPYDQIDQEYLLYSTQTFAEDILRTCSKDGTTVQSINFAALKDYLIPIAPFLEQRRIVTKIEEI